jgi:hypothetical protein
VGRVGIDGAERGSEAPNGTEVRGILLESGLATN